MTKKNYPLNIIYNIYSDEDRKMLQLLNNASPFQRYLNDRRACVEARLWAGKKSSTTVWKTCPESTWLLWWLRRHSDGPKYLDRLDDRLYKFNLKLDTLDDPTEKDKLKLLRTKFAQPWREPATRKVAPKKAAHAAKKKVR